MEGDDFCSPFRRTPFACIRCFSKPLLAASSLAFLSLCLLKKSCWSLLVTSCCIIFVSQGKLVASCWDPAGSQKSCLLKIFDLASWSCEKTLPLFFPAKHIDISEADNSRIFVQVKSRLQALNLSGTDTYEHQIVVGKHVTALRANPLDRNVVVLGDSNGAIWIVDVRAVCY